ncbi:MAG TPA: Gmad2 immunoglobulin-like domain-containing protein [Candidatus Moranbacteria bacterium]|nr:Gmad2 immunoglobulin-like domain-containing protein [Candidatus Moranbacteria bacterium]
MNKKISTVLAFSVIIILAIIVAGISLYLWKGVNFKNNPTVNMPKKNKPVACTEEAKICPDGSAVGRTAPNCEFAPCPEIVGISGKIMITSLKPNDEIISPISISGKAVGGWFFEGDFPGEIYDSNNKILGTHYCSFVPKSQDDTWMTENFVDFKCEIKFSAPKTENGYILFKKDNPSDQRELDEEFKLPVKFSGKTITSNWKTYKNEEYGFEFKYPGDYLEQIIENDSQFDFHLRLNKNNYSSSFEVLGFVAKNNENYDLSSVDNFKKWHNKFMPSTELKDAAEVLINQKKVIKTHEMDGIDSAGEYYYLTLNGVVIAFANDFTKDASIELAFNKILSTFKFTN